MKHLLSFIISICFCTNLAAQEFDIRSFAADPSDLAARRYEKRTVNDEAAALVKVVTNIEGMFFDSNLGIVDVERKEAEYWVYIAPRERRIRLMAQGYLAIDVNMPEPAQSFMTYRMTVVAKGLLPPTTDLVRVVFRMNVDDVWIGRGDLTPVSEPGATRVMALPKGEHTFRFIKDGYEELVKTIDVQEYTEVDIELLPGAPTTTLTLSGFVFISSEPTGADVFLNEQRVGTTPYQGRQLAGNYALMLSHPMYYEHSEHFALEEGATVDLAAIEMMPRFGYWQVTTTPREAEVLLDGRLVGTSPLTRGEISSGEHELSIRKPLYHEHKEIFVVEDGDDKSFDIALEPAYGQLIIDSDQQGAEVFIDGRQVGTTPYENLQQPSGRYNVRVSKELYSDSNEQVIVQDGELTRRFIPLSRNFGTLEVSAEGADIYLDNRLMARDSWNSDLTPGQYRLKASKELHRDAERTVYIVIGETERIELSPQPRLGALSIETQPLETRGATIYIDGQLREETTPRVIPLLIGSYTVSVKKEGYLEVSETVEVIEGREHELNFTMQTFEGSMLHRAQRHKRAKLWYGGAALAAAGAGAYFKYSAMQLYNDYQAETTPDATNIYDRMEQHELISYVALGAAVPLGVIMLVKSVQQKRTQRNVEISAIPVNNGAVLGLIIKF